MSVSLYNTFGNETKYQVLEDMLIQYMDQSTVKFPLPEASVEILSKLFDETIPVDPVLYEQVRERLVTCGFDIKNARAMSDILLRVANIQGVSPLTYFSVSEDTVQFTVDAYQMINTLRPVGNRIGLQTARDNQRTRVAGLIKP